MEPEWLNTASYPFKRNYLELSSGKMHYVDEGKGEVILMLHGNPTWSYTYRKLIKGLSKEYRCIAPDYIGFGLSDKPINWSYKPQDQAENINTLIKSMSLKNLTLVVNDWGGPIGLSYAVNHPENLKRLVILNTWCWSVKGDPVLETFSKVVGGPLGKFFIKYFNFLAKTGIKSAFGESNRLTREVHQHYYRHLANPKSRKGCWQFPKYMLKADEWLKNVWERKAVIEEKPVMLAWGLKDFAFRKEQLEKFSLFFKNKTVFTFDDTGHFVQEEKGNELVPLIKEFFIDHP